MARRGMAWCDPSSLLSLTMALHVQGLNSWLMYPTMTWERGDNVAEYIAALYWATSTLTLIGAGGVAPVSSPERIWAVFTVLVGEVG